MLRPENCLYKNLTAAPCYMCPCHIVDTDECQLNYDIDWMKRETSTYCESNTFVCRSPTLEEKIQAYNRKREELLQLSKETLVDLIIGKPDYYY